jgi:hypothetical protein
MINVAWMAFRYQGYPGVEIIPSFSAASYLVLGLYVKEYLVNGICQALWLYK